MGVSALLQDFNLFKLVGIGGPGQEVKDRVVVAPQSGGSVGVSQESENITASGLGSKTR